MTRRLMPIWLALAVVVTACATGERPTLEQDAAALAPDEDATAESPADDETIIEAGEDPTDASGGGQLAPVPPPSGPPAPNGRSYPALPDSPTAVARQLVDVERALRDPVTDPEALADLGHLQQVSYRVLARHPEWDLEVFAVIPEDLLDDVTAHMAARRAFIDLGQQHDPPTAVPAWRIIEPEPLEDLVDHYREAENATGIEWEFLAAINLVETGMGRIVGLSTAGAQGPMQFLPTTWAEAGIGEGDINDPHDAVQAAARYLVRRGGPTDMARALFGYNNADQYVNAVTAYADLFRRDWRNLVGPYNWEIHYSADIGDLWFPVGYERTESLPADLYVAEAPWSSPPAGVSEPR